MPVSSIAGATAESWAKVITKVGAWTVLAIWLVVQLGGEIKEAVLSTQRAMESHVQATAPLAPTLQAILNVQLQQCINVAGANQTKVNACFSAMHRPPQPPQDR